MIVFAGQSARQAMPAAGLHWAGRFATPLRCSVQAGSTRTRSTSLRSNSAWPFFRLALRCSAAQRRPAAGIAWRARGCASAAPFEANAAIAPSGAGRRSEQTQSSPRRRAVCAGGCLCVAEERSESGLRVCRRTHALRDLTCGSCLSGATQSRSEFCRAGRAREHRREARRVDTVAAPGAYRPTTPPRTGGAP